MPMLLTSCAGAPVLVREPIPVELTTATPRPAIEVPYTAATAGLTLLRYDDQLNACNMDKAAIRALSDRKSK